MGRTRVLAVETLEQDVVILEQTQANMAFDPKVRTVFVNVNGGVEKARQAIRMTVKSETGTG